MKTAQKEEAGNVWIRGDDVVDEWVGDVEMRERTVGVVSQVDNM